MHLKSSVVKSILGSTVFKLGSSAIAFVSVPLLLKSLGTESYGVWVTLTALLAWLNLFDFGSGYSLKNKVTESLVESDKKPLHVLIAGTIQFYLISTAIIFFVFIFCLFYIKAFRENLILTVILYIPVILAFPLTVGHFIMQGLKKFNFFNFISLGQSFVWLAFLFFLRFRSTEVNIYTVAIFYSVLYFIANFCILFFSLRLVTFKWKEIANFEHLKSSKDSLFVGVRFFLLQISSLLLFSLGNIMTYDNLNVKDVAQFDTINKIYLMGITFFNLLISIYWSEISHAKALNDIKKLRKIQRQLMVFSLMFSLGTIIVTLIMPTVIAYWTKDMITVKLNQLYPFVILVCVQYFSFSGAVFLNAFEDLKGQVIFALAASVFIIPLAKYFFYLNIGIGSVPLASAILITPTMLYVLYRSSYCINTLET